MPTRSLVAAVLLTAAAPAAAQPADQDVRCVLAGNAFGATEKDPARKQLALATALFFGGRVDARLSPAQMKAAVTVQGRALTTARLPETMTACAAQFQAKERAMQAIGQEVARAQQPAPAAAAKK